MVVFGGEVGLFKLLILSGLYCFSWGLTGVWMLWDGVVRVLLGRIAGGGLGSELGLGGFEGFLGGGLIGFGFWVFFWGFFEDLDGGVAFGWGLPLSGGVGR